MTWRRVRAASAEGGGRKGAGGPGGLRADARKAEATAPRSRFSDVAGCDEAVEEVRRGASSYSSDPERFGRLGARMPAGVMLTAPPEPARPCWPRPSPQRPGSPSSRSRAPSSWRVRRRGASRVRELFAAGATPRRGSGRLHRRDRRRRAAAQRRRRGRQRPSTSNPQPAPDRDGRLHGNERLVCVGATNRLDVLDPALLRPGRFAARCASSCRTPRAGSQSCRLHARGRPFGGEIDLPEIAEGTAGSSGAELREMLNEGAIMAARDGRPEVGRAELEKGTCARWRDPLSRLDAHAEGARGGRPSTRRATCSRRVLRDPGQRRACHDPPRGRAGGLAVIRAPDRALQSAATCTSS